LDINRKGRLEEIQFVRVFAILGVLCVHGTSTGISGTEVDTIMFYMYIFFNAFGKYGTPTFILLSSFVLFYNYYHRPLMKRVLSKFYSKRLLYVLIPYLVFSFIYYLTKTYHFTGFNDLTFLAKDFLWKLATGKAHSHLYFIFVSVQFYIMFPWFLFLFKKYEFIRKYSLIWGILLQCTWVLVNSHYIHLNFKGSVAFSYMMYYFTGAFLGIYYEKVIAWFKNWRKNGVYISVILISYVTFNILYVSLLYLTRTKKGSYPAIVHELLWSSYAFFGAIIVLIIGHISYHYASSKIRLFMIRLSNASFGIYLIHPLLLFYLRRLLPSGKPIIFHSYQASSFLVALFGSWLITTLVHKYFPYSWILLGQKPHSMKHENHDSWTPPITASDRGWLFGKR
jgi:probable poly-beta-1,6-N-acetyl-D-glucosamine export protein